MIEDLIKVIEELIKWTNSNSGFLSLLLFIATLLIGLVSGLYSSLTSRSKIKVEILKRPAVCMVEKIEKTHSRASFGVYLKIVNIGYSPVDIDSVFLSFQTQSKAWSEKLSSTVCKSEFFEVLDGNKLKILPFLMQMSPNAVADNSSYLNRGQQKNGIVYFESEPMIDSELPFHNQEFKIKIKLFLKDTLGKSYLKDGEVFLVQPQVLRESICSEFGNTKNDLKPKGTESID